MPGGKGVMESEGGVERGVELCGSYRIRRQPCFFFMLAVTIIGRSGSIMGGRQSYAAIYHARHSPVKALDDGWNIFTRGVFPCF